MGIKVGKFIAGRNYRFIKDFTDDMRPIAPIEYHAGDIVTFDGPNMGRARFYVHRGETHELIIVKPREAFKLFEEMPGKKGSKTNG